MSPSYVVTGASGQFGGSAVRHLLDAGVPAAQITALGRTPAKLEPLAALGVQVRQVDYREPAALDGVFAPGDRVLFVSGSDVGGRVPEHANVVRAAAAADVALLAYTSIANADTARITLADEHRATEELLRASRAPFVLLRNSWYIENYTDQLATYLEYGAVSGSAGTGRVSAATRSDYAAAAAAVVRAPDQHVGRTYELGGDEPFSLADLAAEITLVTGTPVAYHDLPVAEYAALLVRAGLPAGYAGVLADSDAGIARGELLVTTGDLARLIGRPATTLRAALAGAAAELSAAAVG